MNNQFKQFQRHDGRTLKIVLSCRCRHMQACNGKLTNGVEEEILRAWLVEHVALPHEVTVINDAGSGAHCTAKSAADAVEMIRINKCDLFVTTSLDRISRRHAVQFLEEAVEAGVRVIAINDKIDTAASDWRRCASLFSRRRRAS